MSKKKYETRLVTTDSIDSIWIAVKHLVAKTSDEIMDETDIYQYLISGDYRLFIIVEKYSKELITAYVTCMAFYPRHKACRIISLAGSNLSEWYKDSIAFVEDYAIREECNYMEVFGRRGWVKIMKDYKEECVILRKQLINKGKYE